MDNLRLSSASMALARAVHMGGQVVLLSAIVLWCNATDVGRFAVATAIAAPVFTLFNLQLRVLYATDTCDGIARANYNALRSLSVALAALIVLALAMLLFPATIGLPLACGIVTAKVAESIGELQYGRLQKHGRSDLVAAALVLRTAVGVIGFVLGIHITGSLEGGCFASAITSTVVTLAYEVPLARGIDRSPAGVSRATDVRSLIRRAAPLGAATALMSVTANTPRYAVAAFGGAEALGEIAAPLQMIPVCQAFASALCFPWVPIIAQEQRSRGVDAALRVGRQCLRRLRRIGVFAAVTVCLGAYLLIGPALGSEYAVSAGLCVGLGIAVGLQFAITGFSTILKSLQMFSRVMHAELRFVVVNAAVTFTAVGCYGPPALAGALPLAWLIGLLVYARQAPPTTIPSSTRTAWARAA